MHNDEHQARAIHLREAAIDLLRLIVTGVPYSPEHDPINDKLNEIRALNQTNRFVAQQLLLQRLGYQHEPYTN